MRIRKHAKISPLLFSTSALSSEALLQTHVCQLNQSPWDVINFPPTDSSPPPLPPPYQVDGDDSFTGNGSLGDSIGAVESAASMKASLEGEVEKDMKEENTPKWVLSGCDIVGDVVAKGEDQLGFSNGGDGSVCCKNDGKGWQCRRAAEEGHSLCEHHLAQLKNYNNLVHPVGKKLDKPPVVENRPRRPRAKKSAAAASASNPHEFYYYSGFGPLWGKKRGTGRAEPDKTASDDVTKPIELVQPMVEAAAAAAATTPSSSSLQINGIDEFNFVEDEDEDDDEENGEIGNKRARKPIKARSLKSLM